MHFQFAQSRELPQKMSSGFTLLELLVTIAIAGTLAALAVPAFEQTIARYRTRAVADDVASAIGLARSEAIRRGGDVKLRKMSGTNNCTDNDKWSCGFRLFFDANRNGGDIEAANDVLLREINVPDGINLINYTSGAGVELRFNRWGQAAGINALHFRVTKTSLATADRSVCVSSAGRVRVVNSIDC